MYNIMQILIIYLSIHNTLYLFRSNKTIKSNYSPRKEKALKIYTLDSKPSNSSSSSQNSHPNSTVNSTQTSQHIVPDLD